MAESVRQVLRRHGLGPEAGSHLDTSHSQPENPRALFDLTRPRRVIAGERALPLRMLTPRDLETSPTLSRVGRLAQASARP